MVANLIVDDLTALQKIHRIRFGNIVDNDPDNKRMLTQPLVYSKHTGANH